MGRRDSTPRHLRHCQQCGTAAVGAKGVWFSSAQQCSTFATNHLDLFWNGQSMREFVNQTHQAAVMDFIVACFDNFSQTD